MVKKVPTLSDKENEGIIDEYTEMTQLAFKQDVDIWHNKYRVDNPLFCLLYTSPSPRDQA